MTGSLRAQLLGASALSSVTLNTLPGWKRLVCDRQTDIAALVAQVPDQDRDSIGRQIAASWSAAGAGRLVDVSVYLPTEGGARHGSLIAAERRGARPLTELAATVHAAFDAEVFDADPRLLRWPLHRPATGVDGVDTVAIHALTRTPGAHDGVGIEFVAALAEVSESDIYLPDVRAWSAMVSMNFATFRWNDDA